MPGAALPPLIVAVGAAAWIMALTAAVARRQGVMLGWGGLALATNPLAIFWMPVIVALSIGRRVPARLWPIAPLSFLGATILLRIAAWPTPDFAAIYLGQAGRSPAMAMDAPNIWAIVLALPWIGELPLAGLAIAATLGASAWFIAHFAWRPPAGSEVIAAGLLSALVAAGLLPGMNHESFFMAGILALMLAVMRGGRWSWMIFALIATGSMLGLLGHFTDIKACAIVGAVPMIVATVLIARRFLVSPANDNGLPLNLFRAYPA
ncbi:MAG TPA: hypothetical protein VF485_05315 [Sphingomonas sp.]